jgi:hypothetical protein
VNADKAKAKKLSWQTHRNKALFASIPIIIWGKNKKKHFAAAIYSASQ